ncbi:hypothetical protein COLO4_15781 [Corchorus olitorius]|uniref:Uncharacterized protein n=1 Tax=Corchorus olitorius TaxID=93759 RepID=A0A1R3JL65_9ROSI|nr:hypothetical protein COLO4_15781 [Corchorus olitorius]
MGVDMILMQHIYGKPLPPPEAVCYPPSSDDPNDIDSSNNGSIESPYGKDAADKPVAKPGNGGKDKTRPYHVLMESVRVSKIAEDKEGSVGAVHDKAPAKEERITNGSREGLKKNNVVDAREEKDDINDELFDASTSLVLYSRGQTLPDIDWADLVKVVASKWAQIKSQHFASSQLTSEDLEDRQQHAKTKMDQIQFNGKEDFKLLVKGIIRRIGTTFPLTTLNWLSREGIEEAYHAIYGMCGAGGAKMLTQPVEHEGAQPSPKRVSFLYNEEASFFFSVVHRSRHVAERESSVVTVSRPIMANTGHGIDGFDDRITFF